MKIFNSNRKYNLLTLRPTTKEDRKEFWNFRSEDINEMFTYYVGFGFLYLALHLFNYVKDPTRPLLSQLASYSVLVALRFVVWLIGKSYKKNLVYLTFALYICNSSLLAWFYSA